MPTTVSAIITPAEIIGTVGTPAREARERRSGPTVAGPPPERSRRPSGLRQAKINKTMLITPMAAPINAMTSVGAHRR